MPARNLVELLSHPSTLQVVGLATSALLSSPFGGGGQGIARLFCWTLARMMLTVSGSPRIRASPAAHLLGVLHRGRPGVLGVAVRTNRARAGQGVEGHDQELDVA